MYYYMSRESKYYYLYKKESQNKNYLCFSKYDFLFYWIAIAVVFEMCNKQLPALWVVATIISLASFIPLADLVLAWPIPLDPRDKGDVGEPER